MQFKKRYGVAGAFILLVMFLASRLEIRGSYEGIFVLRGDTPLSFRITDDAFHGEQSRIMFSMPLHSHDAIFSVPASYAHTDTALTYDWNEKTGRGYVASNFPNGTKLIASFGRYVEGMGVAPSGLFLGGNLPFAVNLGGQSAFNATGMSYYDGARWNHIWCSVNEAFLGNNPQSVNISPSRMKYLGSKILKATDRELVLTSSHEIGLNDTTLLMRRYAFFKAGDLHFMLVNRVSNIGQNSADFSYVYGDEPWVGNFGTSRGDVGWLKDRIVNEEGAIDTNVHSFAGMFDYGNSLINENHNFTWTANFIEWFGDRPDTAFFSNNPGYFDDQQHPLSSDTRFIGLQWEKKVLRPGASRTFIVAIGMAGRDAMSGFPVKPKVDFPHEAYQEFVK